MPVALSSANPAPPSCPTADFTTAMNSAARAQYVVVVAGFFGFADQWQGAARYSNMSTNQALRPYDKVIQRREHARDAVRSAKSPRSSSLQRPIRWVDADHRTHQRQRIELNSSRCSPYTDLSTCIWFAAFPPHAPPPAGHVRPGSVGGRPPAERKRSDAVSDLRPSPDAGNFLCVFIAGVVPPARPDCPVRTTPVPHP